jgi:hypothetical protein
MSAEKLGERGNLFVDLGTVFHGAGAQGIEALIDAKVRAREPQEMPDNFHL